MLRCKLRTPWPIHFKLRIVIGIDSLMVCILFGEISIFHSRVMGLYSSNCRRFFVCRAVNWEPLGQFTSNFAQLLELIVLWSVYFLVKFRFFIQELWERVFTNIVWMLTTGVSCALGTTVYYQWRHNVFYVRLTDKLAHASYEVTKYFCGSRLQQHTLKGKCPICWYLFGLSLCFFDGKVSGITLSVHSSICHKYFSHF